MKKKLLGLILAGLLGGATLAALGNPVAADSFHHPPPPKCTPASTPGCS